MCEKWLRVVDFLQKYNRLVLLVDSYAASLFCFLSQIYTKYKQSCV